MSNVKKILIVDDDLNLSGILKNSFEKEGFEVEQAFDGAEGYSVLTSMDPKPVAITLDIMMPTLNGFDFLERMKAVPEHKDIPVVALTSMEGKENEQKMKSLGAVDFLVKTSVDPHEIIDKVKSLIK